MKHALKARALQLGVAAALGGTALDASASFSITLNFAPNVTLAEQVYINAAKSFWESQITGYAPGVTVTGIAMDVSVEAAVPGLAAAAPDDGVEQGGFLIPTHGIIQFNSQLIGGLVADGSIVSTAKHEMGHVLGMIGSVWPYENDASGNPIYLLSSLKYTGPYGLAAYRVEFNQPNAAFIPVETDESHWAEGHGGRLTGIVDRQGRDMAYELMTHWLNEPAFTSQTTIQSLRDLGYTVVSSVPEPGSIALWLAGIPLLLGFGLRRPGGRGCQPQPEAGRKVPHRRSASNTTLERRGHAWPAASGEAPGGAEARGRDSGQTRLGRALAEA